MKLLEGKVAFVTGATRGIGRAIALKFAEQGANIAFTYLSSVAAAESLVVEIEALGVRAVGFASNASDFEEAHKVVEKAVAEFGQIDILVNNAGQTKDGLILRMSEEQWDSIIDTNLKSAFNFTHAVVPLMSRGCNRKYVIGCGYERKCWTGKLFSLEGGTYRTYQIGSKGDGRARNTLQRHRSRLYRYRYDRQVER